MKITVEFVQSKSPHFRNVLRLCKRFKTYRTFEEDGLSVHSVQFTEADLDSFEAIEQMIFSWKTASYYLNDSLASRGAVWDAVIAESSRRRALKQKMAAHAPGIAKLTDFLGNSDLKN